MPRLHPRRLLTVGSIVADMRIEVPHLPPRGGDVVGTGFSVSAGGGFNVLCAAARNGLPCVFAGRHGTGPQGDRIRADLAREGIAALLAPSPEGDSGFCLVMVEPDGERSFVTSPGVEARLGGRKLAGLTLQPHDVVFISGYDLSYRELGREIASWVGRWRGETLLVVDPGPLVRDIPGDILDAMLGRAGILTLNRREAGLLSAAQDLDGIAAAIVPRLAADALLIIRDGPQGCFLFGAGLPDPPVHVGAPEVEALDSTGAGDTHTGVIVAAMAAGLDPIAAATRANAAAAISVTRRGPATAPAKKELDAFLRTWSRCQARPSGGARPYEPATINNGETTP